jgi:uncharacterized radical SAM protein YgiQ
MASNGRELFIPATIEEAGEHGWERFDVILVSGDAYIDAPSSGVSVIGHVLMGAGYRVGIISQPDTGSDRDIARLGEPLLYWGVTSGSVDSLISNYTATGKRRMNDDLTPGGKNTRRPDRAVIAYTNLIRRRFKHTAPIVIGGLEASLRRTAHYDYRDAGIRRSILFDSKADILVYGMGERSALALAARMQAGDDWREIPGICYISGDREKGYVELPSFEAAADDSKKFLNMLRMLFRNSDPACGEGMVQRHGDRFLIHNPPSPPLSARELDRVHDLPYERDVHPVCKKMGEVRALETVRFSIATHRGCFGGCNFCAIGAHQGSMIISRSVDSICREAKSFTRHPDFRGIIPDIGGATANMYGMGCRKMETEGACIGRRCLSPRVCGSLKISHRRQIDLLRRIRAIPGVKKAFIASGIRHDLVLADRTWGEEYLSEIVLHHVSGQLKVAPEHSVGNVLALMGKPLVESLIEFRSLFNRLSRCAGKKQYLTYYLIAAHPGCTLKDMADLRGFVHAKLRLSPEQVQIFTPSPSTWSSFMYYAGEDPFTGKKIFVERNNRKKERQKRALISGAKQKKGDVMSH